VDPTRNLSLMQYVDSKLPNAHLARHHKTSGASAQALQQYFASQQSKYEVRSTRNVHIFDEKLGNVCV
jgi:predicted acetyltransferase